MQQKLSPSEPIRGGVHADQRHDSAHKHVTGAARVHRRHRRARGTLHAYLGLADKAHAEIVSIDLDAVRAEPGVVGVLTARDIPGTTTSARSASTTTRSSPTDKVEFHGQPLFAVIAETRDAARRAAAKCQGRVPTAPPPHRRRRRDRGGVPLRHRAR